jgi:EAL domain-containing protein (putative c-di-GMP-specific phosphodiesterase class I)
MSAMPAPYTLRRPAAPATARREEIGRVIGGRHFTLALQPVVGVASRAEDHVEALLRPAAPALPPRAFVAAAEAEGLGPALDRAVLAAAREVPRRVSVNVCARSLQDRGFVREARDCGVFAVEIVRSEAIDDLAAVATAVGELREAGLRVALDEVDGRAASRALLRAARFDALKIAGSVLRAAMAGARGRLLFAELLRLAAALGAVAVATHIETLPQLWAAERAGAALAQGWLLGAPAPWRGAGSAA